MRALVVGAGYVGGALARELVAGGHRVTALRRRPEPLGDGVEVLAADVTAGTLQLPRDLDAIVYAISPDASGDAEYERAYVDGVRAVLAAARGTERVVFTSSTAVYAQDDGSLVDETSEVTGAGHARFLLAGEALVHAAGGTVLRLSGIYGPGRDRIVRMVREGTARITTPSPFGNRIHQLDCAGAIAHVLSLASPAPVYVGVDDAPVELAEVYRWIASELGVEPPPAGEGDARSRGTTRKRCSNRLLRASGYHFRYPTYREGYGEMLRPLRL